MTKMEIFEVGDRVVFNVKSVSYLYGKIGTVVAIEPESGSNIVYFDDDVSGLEFKEFGVPFKHGFSVSANDIKLAKSRLGVSSKRVD